MQKSKMNYRAWRHRCWLIPYMTREQVWVKENQAAKNSLSTFLNLMCKLLSTTMVARLGLLLYCKNPTKFLPVCYQFMLILISI